MRLAWAVQERLSRSQYASVAPVILGVAITTITEAEVRQRPRSAKGPAPPEATPPESA